MTSAGLRDLKINLAAFLQLLSWGCGAASSLSSWSPLPLEGELTPARVMPALSGVVHRVVVSVVQPKETGSSQGFCHWLEAQGRLHTSLREVTEQGRGAPHFPQAHALCPMPSLAGS